MWQKLKELKWNFIIAALIYIALGVVLLVWPDVTSVFLCTLLGVLLLGYGLFEIIGFFAKTDEGWGWGVLDLVMGLAAFGFGVFSLLRPAVVLSFLPAVLGCVVIVDSCISLKRSFQLKSLGMERWWVVTLLSALVILAGLVMVFNPFASLTVLVRVIGVLLIYEGISDLVTIRHVAVRTRQAIRDAQAVEGKVVDERDR